MLLDKWSLYADENYSLDLELAVGVNGSTALETVWALDQVSAGALSVGLGDLPQVYDDPNCDSDIYPCENWNNIIQPGETFTELYTRQYVKFKAGFEVDDGTPSSKKFHRVRVLSDFKLAAELEVACVGANDPYDCCTGFETDDGNCADDTAHPTAYQGHFWPQPNTTGGGTIGALYFNSTRGVDANGVVVDTGNNCSAGSPVCSHVWFDQVRGSAVLWQDYASDSEWFCVESHVKLNTAGQTNGVEEFWVDDWNTDQSPDARNDTQNMLYSYNAYGLNQVVFDTYWNNGSPAENTMYRDNIVIGTERIGCAISYEPTGVLAWQPFDWRLFR
jgi:hypothetical protein